MACQYSTLTQLSGKTQLYSYILTARSLQNTLQAAYWQGWPLDRLWTRVFLECTSNVNTHWKGNIQTKKKHFSVLSSLLGCIHLKRGKCCRGLNFATCPSLHQLERLNEGGAREFPTDGFAYPLVCSGLHYWEAFTPHLYSSGIPSALHFLTNTKPTTNFESGSAGWI